MHPDPSGFKGVHTQHSSGMCLLPAYHLKLLECNTNSVILSLRVVFFIWPVDVVGEQQVVTCALGIIKIDPDIRVGA